MPVLVTPSFHFTNDTHSRQPTSWRNVVDDTFGGEENGRFTFTNDTHGAAMSKLLSPPRFLRKTKTLSTCKKSTCSRSTQGWLFQARESSWPPDWSLWKEPTVQSARRKRRPRQYASLVKASMSSARVASQPGSSSLMSRRAPCAANVSSTGTLQNRPAQWR